MANRKPVYHGSRDWLEAAASKMHRRWLLEAQAELKVPPEWKLRDRLQEKHIVVMRYLDAIEQQSDEPLIKHYFHVGLDDHRAMIGRTGIILQKGRAWEGLPAYVSILIVGMPELYDSPAIKNKIHTLCKQRPELLVSFADTLKLDDNNPAKKQGHVKTACAVGAALLGSIIAMNVFLARMKNNEKAENAPPSDPVATVVTTEPPIPSAQKGQDITKR